MSVPPRPPYDDPDPAGGAPDHRQHPAPPGRPDDTVRLPDPTADTMRLPSAAEAAPAPGPAPGETAAPAAPPRQYLSGIVTAGLAAVCGALITSWAGVQGTLVGAMIGATIGSGISEIVRAPLDALEGRIIRAGVSAARLRRDGLLKTVLSSSTAAQAALGFLGSRGAVVAAGTVAIVGFLLALGGITAVEAARGAPLAAIVADAPQTGTTIGNVIPNPPPVLAPAPTAPPAAAPGRTSAVAGGAVAANDNDRPPSGTPAVASPTATTGSRGDRPDGAARPGSSPSPAPGGAAAPASPNAVGPPAVQTATAQARLTAIPTAGVTPDATAVPVTATAQAATATAQAATATYQAATATVQAATATAQIATATVQATVTPTSGGRPPAAARPPITAPPAAQPADTPTPTATPTPTPTPTATLTVS